ncbi:MAG: acyl-CoA synthetase [Acetobacteraceae bacterium]|nr:acyl-CoA synthetase [Acetobacteraceae bacterium]
MTADGRYHELYRNFRWEIPRYFNIARDVCDRQNPRQTALIAVEEGGAATRYTFSDVAGLANRLGNALSALGVGAGDRVGIVLPQGVEAAVAHLATYKLKAIAVPLFTLFGPEALEYRLRDSGARAVIVDAENLPKILDIRPRLPDLAQILAVGGPQAGAVDLWQAVSRASPRLRTARTRADDPALLIYTSGTTGPPKGALHAHRVLLGHLPGVSFPHNFFPQPGDLFWTPADWAWIGGLLDVLFPSWHFGVPVVACRFRKFDPERAFGLMAEYGVRNVFLPPTALKMMRQVSQPRRRFALALRTIASGGEPLGEEVLRWGQEELGITINEFYGQTEANLVVGNSAEVMEVRAGSMGRPIPGHTVSTLDESGRPLPPGETGEIAVWRDDPVMFLGYWRDPQATERKFAGGWALTGDMARRDEDGYFWFVGRKDDVISSGGYRIGPGEIEDCLLKHPAVAMAAAVGKPDAVRGSIVKAFVVLNPGFEPSPRLAAELQELVKTRLGAHEYPREVEFTSSLPLTATGKIKRRDLRLLEESRLTSGGR